MEHGQALDASVLDLRKLTPSLLWYPPTLSLCRAKSPTVIMMSRSITCAILLCLALLSSSSLAFVPASSRTSRGGRPDATASSSSNRRMAVHSAVLDKLDSLLASTNDAVLTSSSSLLPSISSSSSYTSSTQLLSVATLDPTSVLSDALGGLLGSYAILAVPVIAGVTVVATIAFLIVSYANPADEDD